MKIHNKMHKQRCGRTLRPLSNMIECLRTTTLIAIVLSVAIAGHIGAQEPNLPETAIGLSKVILKRLPRGLSVSEAKRRLARLGFACVPGQSGSNFGPVGNASFIYCERREAGKAIHGVVKRWQLAIIYNKGKVTSVQAAFNPVYP